MDNIKNDNYYIKKISMDLSFVLTHTAGLSQAQFEQNEILIDSVLFRLIQISENAERLTYEFKESHSNIPWHAIRGLRNRIVHEYGNVDLTVIYNTVINDLPILLKEIEKIL